jgi:hypothetical protein
MTRALRSLLPGILFLSAAGAALADPPAQPANPAPAAPAATTAVDPANVKPNPGDKVICKYEIPTGSRLGGHKTCMKKSDWDAQAAASQAAMNQRIGSGTNTH